MDMPFTMMKGRTIIEIQGEQGSEELIFTCAGNERFKMFHQQDCCESVELAEIVGDLNDVIGHEIIEAEVVTNSEDDKPDDHADSWTWTFYKLGTKMGFVTLRWLGQSNGYYSESVDFVALNRKRNVLNWR
jgi:hypothetical protein